jgi:DNA-binding response OmpR family regulator
MFSVFVVDDDLHQLHVIGAVVAKGAHVNVQMFSKPFLAFDAAVTSPPDLLIVDMMMPQMDGVTLVRELRKAGVESKAIILTAYNKEAIRSIVPGNRIEEVLSKPLELKKLLEFVIAALPQPAGA